MLCVSTSGDYVPILEPRKHSILRIALRGVHVDSSFAAQDVPLSRKVRQWPHRETNAVRKRCVCTLCGGSRGVQ